MNETWTVQKRVGTQMKPVTMRHASSSEQTAERERLRRKLRAPLVIGIILNVLVLLVVGIPAIALQTATPVIVIVLLSLVGWAILATVTMLIISKIAAQPRTVGNAQADFEMTQRRAQAHSRRQPQTPGRREGDLEVFD